MDNWNKIRTAACVARVGTISLAAEQLRVHRATVTRHIDTLERELGGKLFQRHARGFTATELGLELLRIADATDEQFGQLHRIASKNASELSGEFVVTSLELLAPDILPLLAKFRAKHRQVKTRFLSSDEIVKLEYGKAHIAFRAGPKPQDPDNVVKPFCQTEMGLFASKDYIKQFGMPGSEKDFKHHHFIGSPGTNPRSPVSKWMNAHIPDHAYAFFSNRLSVNFDAIFKGNGIGFISRAIGLASPDLVEVMPPLPEWRTTSWIVTHVDLHRSPKVQAFLDILRKETKN